MEQSQIEIRDSAAPVFTNLENQMSAIQALGEAITKSGFAGCEKVEQGVIVAFTCLAEKITPIEFSRTYDIIHGRPTKKASVMLAEFRSKYGGDFDWVDDGEDGKAATLTLIYKGSQKKPVSFTLEEAKQKGLSSKPNWKMHLPEMLRARCITKALRMHVPEIAAGIYDPHELDDAPQPTVMVSPGEINGIKVLGRRLESLDPNSRREAESKILKRFKVKSMTDLSDENISRVIENWDVFIEGLKIEASSK
jgi:hypothetical protein